MRVEETRQEKHQSSPMSGVEYVLSEQSLLTTVENERKGSR